jgi:hypothetical protein
LDVLDYLLEGVLDFTLSDARSEELKYTFELVGAGWHRVHFIMFTCASRKAWYKVGMTLLGFIGIFILAEIIVRVVFAQTD